MRRKGAEAIHFIQSTDEIPLKEGDEVTQIVDWERRQDHMQQHSGQHLITAVFEKELKMITKSWWMGSGESSSYIELDTKDVTQDQLNYVEKVANECIAKQVPVEITLHDISDPFLDQVRSAKDVPEDVQGPLRVCNIQGLDKNLCCGTHVSNLAQLQVIKLLHVEKAKGKVLVHFLVGNRVVQRLQRCLEREQKLTSILNGGPESHFDLTKKLQNTVKTNQKLLKNLARELAAFEIEKFKSSPEKRFYIIHRHDGIDQDFMSFFMKGVSSAVDTLIFITLGDDKGASFNLQGPAGVVEKLGPQICSLLDGKGNGKGGRFQGKFSNFKKVTDCDNLIKNFFE